MPGWIDMPATPETQWASAAFVNQFIRAFNERVAVTWNARRPHDNYGFLEVEVGYSVSRAGSSYNYSSDGDYQYSRNLYLAAAPFDFDDFDDGAGAGGWGTMQSGLQLLCREFQDPGGPLPSGTDDPPPPYTLAEWRAKAGLHPDGFTRKFVRTFRLGDPNDRVVVESGNWGMPEEGMRARSLNNARTYRFDPDQTVVIYKPSFFGGPQAIETHWIPDPGEQADVLVGHGVMRAGDYLGSWVFNELRAGLDALTATLGWKGRPDAFTTNGGWVYGGLFGLGPSTYQEAVEDAEQQFAERLALYAPPYFQNNQSLPRGRVGVSHDTRNGGEEHWRAAQEFRHRRVGMVSVPGGSGRVRVWMLAEDHPDYDDFGLGLTPGQWTLVTDRQADAEPAEVYWPFTVHAVQSEFINPPALQPWPAGAADLEIGEGVGRSFEVSSAVALVDHDFEFRGDP